MGKRKQEDETGSCSEQEPQPAIKLTIKIAGNTVGMKSFSVSEAEQNTSTNNDYFSEHSDDDDNDETMWLEALESGQLDDNGSIRRHQSTCHLTARQLALVQGQKDDELTVSSTAATTIISLNADQLKRRQLHAVKRRERAQLKTEKDKKETVERLLKKQDSKCKTHNKFSNRDSFQSKFVYVNNQSTISISFPAGLAFPLEQQNAVSLTASTVKKLCGVEGCSNARKYCCSVTGIPLCSLLCYQRNIAMTRQTMDH